MAIKLVSNIEYRDLSNAIPNGVKVCAYEISGDYSSSNNETVEWAMKKQAERGGSIVASDIVSSQFEGPSGKFVRYFATTELEVAAA